MLNITMKVYLRLILTMCIDIYFARSSRDFRDLQDFCRDVCGCDAYLNSYGTAETWWKFNQRNILGSIDDCASRCGCYGQEVMTDAEFVSQEDVIKLECGDTVMDCAERFMNGESCNSLYMSTYCRKTCLSCVCQDMAPDCKPDHCSSTQLEANCRGTCQSCTCRDTSDECTERLNTGEKCDSVFMHDNCRGTCNNCHCPFKELEVEPQALPGPVGRFANSESCQKGNFVRGIQVKYLPRQENGDNVGITGITFFCAKPEDSDEQVESSQDLITSGVHPLGIYGKIHICKNSVAKGIGFYADVYNENDNSIVTSIDMYCYPHYKSGEGNTIHLQTEGFREDPIPSIQIHCTSNIGGGDLITRDLVLCGLTTRIVPFQSEPDEVGLTGAKFKCCCDH